ncbi:hypothetical protein [Nesterenkonia pannonica]|uniref:hypothetical protein n=1 Tax=Nesterenkonia pannonica TaxID=1548602 RepID=UPI002164DB78|nr:hypothetical protein [Nesterenkonia pannonica]
MIISVIAAGTLVLVLEYTQTALLGQGSGVWGLTAAVVLYVGISLLTRAPRARAEEFIACSNSSTRSGDRAETSLT